MRILFCLLTLLSISMPVDADNDIAIVGTWRLVTFVNIVDGERVYPFGESPKGYFTYTSDGCVMIQIQNEVPPESWKSLETNADGFGDTSPWYVGYFGRYTVDFEAGEVIHHVEGGMLLHYIGTDQRRPFVVDGDKLFIGESGAWERELIRLN